MELIRSVLHYFFAFVCLVVGLYALSRTVKFASGMSRIWNFFTTSMTLLGFTLSLLMLTTSVSLFFRLESLGKVALILLGLFVLEVVVTLVFFDD